MQIPIILSLNMFIFIIFVDALKLHVKDLPQDHKRQITLGGAGITTPMVSHLEIPGNHEASQFLNCATRKLFFETSLLECVNINRGQRT